MPAFWRLPERRASKKFCPLAATLKAMRASFAFVRTNKEHLSKRFFWATK
jgi:hypothetical protein